MVFRRRTPRSWARAAAEALWPRGGWARAGQYVRHRLRRLPDSPEKIGRGMAAGVFTAFTPFFGVHFIVAWGCARAIKGNVLAALIGSFVNNFLTFVPIAALAMEIGHLILGTRAEEGLMGNLGHVIADAGGDFWRNFLALFTAERADWSGLATFYREAFVPYLLGGLLPGLVGGALAYGATVPLVRAYQAARRKALQDKLAQLRAPPGM